MFLETNYFCDLQAKAVRWSWQRPPLRPKWARRAWGSVMTSSSTTRTTAWTPSLKRWGVCGSVSVWFLVLRATSLPPYTSQFPARYWPNFSPCWAQSLSMHHTYQPGIDPTLAHVRPQDRCFDINDILPRCCAIGVMFEVLVFIYDLSQGILKVLKTCSTLSRNLCHKNSLNLLLLCLLNFGALSYFLMSKCGWKVLWANVIGKFVY